MKLMKKISAILLALCLTIPSVSIIAQAAGGSITFTDPESSVGSEVEVTCALRSDSTVGDFTVTLAYDNTAIEFLSATGAEVSAANGQLTCTGTGATEEGVYRFQMNFKSLKQGETKITIAGNEVKTADGEAVEGREGTSTIKIAAGANGETEIAPTTTGTAGGTVEIDGKQYTAMEIPEIMLPVGYVLEPLTYNEASIPAMKHETSGAYITYLSDAEAGESLYYYDAENNAFVRCEQINITSDSYIFILDKMKGVEAPKNYEEIVFTFNEKEYPAWQNAKDIEKADLYLIHALSSNGETCFYQYDDAEGTYQRYMEEAPVKTDEKKEKASGPLDKVTEFVEDNALLVAVAALAVFVLGFIILITLAVKLRHRNKELDELYLMLDGKDGKKKTNEPKAKKSDKSKFKKRDEEDDWDVEEWSDEEDDDWSDDDYEDDYDEDDDWDEDYEEEGDFEDYDDEDDFEDYEDEESDDWDDDLDYDEDDWDDDFEDEDFVEEDLDDLLEQVPDKAKKKKASVDDDLDDYLDFLDLDD